MEQDLFCIHRFEHVKDIFGGKGRLPFSPMFHIKDFLLLPLLVEGALFQHWLAASHNDLAPIITVNQCSLSTAAAKVAVDDDPNRFFLRKEALYFGNWSSIRRVVILVFPFKDHMFSVERDLDSRIVIRQAPL